MGRKIPPQALVQDTPPPQRPQVCELDIIFNFHKVGPALGLGLRAWLGMALALPLPHPTPTQRTSSAKICFQC